MISRDVIQIKTVLFYQIFRATECVWTGKVHIILIITKQIIITDKVKKHTEILLGLS